VNRAAPTPYNISPGTYDPGTLDQTTCVKLCGGGNYQFAALELGNVCLCGGVSTDPSTTETGCTSPCAGNGAQKCGGSTQADTFKSAIPIEGLVLGVTPAGIFSPDDDMTIDTSYTKGADLTFTYTFTDLVDDAQNFKKKFRLPGSYDVHVSASNPIVTVSSSK
jgi:hypothetical protein